MNTASDYETPTANQHRGFRSELEARKRAAADMPAKRVVIIESNGEFYVEPADDAAGFLRSWERECYNGSGIQAIPKNARECQRCAQFMKKPGTCPRCRTEVS